MSAMEAALNRLGIEVEWCEILQESTAGNKLEKIIGKRYDAIIDFNSNLPLAITEDGVSFPNLVDAPFYNYIVDHPMFHHPIINLELNNYHIICIDRNHKKYIEALYPNIKTVTFMPLAAMPALQEVDFEQKKPIILFPGTFMPSKGHYDIIQEFTADRKKIANALIERMISEPYITLERALADLLNKNGNEISPEIFKQKILEYYRVDYYVRTYYREQLVEGLLKAELPIEVLGNGWENFKSSYSERLKIRTGVSYALGLQMIANAQVSLNVQPLFKDGIHDRVFTAMANKTLAVTDTSCYMEECFTDEKDLILYQQGKIDVLAQKLWTLLENPNRIEEIAMSGYKKVQKYHLWDNRIKEFVKG